MSCNHLPGDYNGGPSLTEWLAQIWKAVKSIVENGVKNPHKLTITGDVEAEYDGSKDVTVDISGGGGGGTGDVTAAGNNTFSGTNKFTGRVDFESNVYLGDNTHLNTPTSNENATNKLYVDTVTGTAQTTAVDTAKNYTDEQIAGAIGVGDTTTLEPGNNATVTESVVGGVHKFSFGIPKGEKGNDGTKGDTGPAGPYTDIEIGSVTTGEPGTNAEASFDTATPGMALLDLKIPRGEPGTNGATGPAGHDGAPGAAAGFGVVDATATTGTTAGATVTTDGPDTAKNMHFAFTIPTGGGGGGGDTPIVYEISSATVTGPNIASQNVNAQVVQIGKQLIIRGYLLAFAKSGVTAVTGIDLKFSSSVPSLPSNSSKLMFNNPGFYVSETKISNTFELQIDKKLGNEYLLTFKQGSNCLNLTATPDGELGFFYMVVFL